MSGGSRIVAIEPEMPHGSSDPLAITAPPAEDDAAPLSLEAEWDEDAALAAARPIGPIGALMGAAILIAGWTALWWLANRAALLTGGALAWANALRDWSGPVAVVALVWLIALRHSRREAARFGDAAAALSAQSAALEARLKAINGELGLAREFLAAQTRDLDSLGRIATDRLGEHAQRLAELVEDNGTRVETIGSVSAAALENMEKLRAQLPVMASAAKDVTNNIGTAGRTAHAQLEDMISAFNKLNAFGQASERQVGVLRALVAETMTEFAQRAEQLDAIATGRFAALTERSAAYRAELDIHESDAAAAARRRSEAILAELAATHAQLGEHEDRSLAVLAERLAALRGESEAFAATLREGEAHAQSAWHAAQVRLDQGLSDALARVSDAEAAAAAAAHERIAATAAEIAALDSELRERLTAAERELEQRRADHAAHVERMADHGAQLAAAMELHAERMRTAAGDSESAGAATQAAAAALTEHLARSRATLAETEAALGVLTDHSVRLLELIQASVQHGRNDLPAALGHGEARLTELEERSRTLAEVVAAAETSGKTLLGHTERSQRAVSAALAGSEQLHQALAEHTAQHGAALDRIHTGLASTHSEARALAEAAQGELSAAISELDSAARRAIEQIESMSDEAVAALAARIGESSAAAIDRAIAERTDLLATRLEAASTRAADLGHGAVGALRDQLARVDELAGNLEQRVSQARARAEEQVDNDFARRMAVITDTLNSSAIDITRAIDTDVSDPAWASYLKGDRGIFTRRAVRLLETGEARAVSQLYQADSAFAAHVSRYIHDFEAMLRQLLSTRDGHALSVTMLSSDMGKLYVALAQAIDRLRD